MRNTGVLLFLFGIFIFLNASNFTAVIRHPDTNQISFLNQKEKAPAKSAETGNSNAN